MLHTIFYVTENYKFVPGDFHPLKTIYKLRGYEAVFVALTTWSGVRISPQEPIQSRVCREASPWFILFKPCYKRLPCKPFVSKVLESSISQKSCPQTVLGLSLRVSTHSSLERMPLLGIRNHSPANPNTPRTIFRGQDDPKIEFDSIFTLCFYNGEK